MRFMLPLILLMLIVPFALAGPTARTVTYQYIATQQLSYCDRDNSNAGELVIGGECFWPAAGESQVTFTALDASGMAVPLSFGVWGAQGFLGGGGGCGSVHVALPAGALYAAVSVKSVAYLTSEIGVPLGPGGVIALNPHVCDGPGTTGTLSATFG